MKKEILIILPVFLSAVVAKARKGNNQIGIVRELAFSIGHFGHDFNTGYRGSVKSMSGVGKCAQPTFTTFHKTGKSYIMKQLSCILITVFLLTSMVNAQIDTAHNADSSILKSGKVFNRKNLLYERAGNEDTMISSLYLNRSFQSDYRLYTVPVNNINYTPKGTALSIAGTILLSLFADKTNHVYQPSHSTH